MDDVEYFLDRNLFPFLCLYWCPVQNCLAVNININEVKEGRRKPGVRLREADFVEVSTNALKTEQKDPNIKKQILSKNKTVFTFKPLDEGSIKVLI